MIDSQEDSIFKIQPVQSERSKGPQDIGGEAGSEEQESRPRREIQFNPYAMVLSELTQEELSEFKEETIRSVIKEGKEEAKTANPTRSTAVLVSEAVRIALRKLRSKLPKKDA